MKKFLLKLILITVIFVAVDKVFLFLEEKSPELEYDRRLESTLEGEMNKDIVIFGSSRGARSMIAEDIENELGVSTYNLSYHGTNLDFHNFLLDAYLAHNTKPSLIILSVDDYNSFLNRKTIFRADKLYSFTKYPEVREALVERGEKIPYLTDILVSHRIHRNALFLKQEVSTDFNALNPNGSMTIQGSHEKFLADTMPYPLRTITYNFGRESETLLNKYEAFVNTCDSLEIPLLITCPPNFRPPTQNFRLLLDKITDNRAGIYYYNEEDSAYQTKQVFYDAEHLNRTGAEIYTADLITFLRANYFKPITY